MSDPVLRAELGRVLGRPVTVLACRPWAYSTSAAMHEVEVAGGLGLLLKDVGAGPRPSRPAFLVDPAREAEAYATLPAALDLPAFHGAVRWRGRPWLVLERLDAVPLWQRADLAAWEATARWAARLHAAPVVPMARALRQDAAHLHRWIDRAVAMAPAGALDGVEEPARRAATRLAGLPACRLHGELYPSNVLVQDGPDGSARVRPVDWEGAGTGPGVLDLAALVAGRWEPARRAQVVAAYRAALPAVPAGFDRALADARLLVALQWLGWSDAWRPPPEHEHDWAADARALAAPARSAAGARP